MKRNLRIEMGVVVLVEGAERRMRACVRVYMYVSIYECAGRSSRKFRTTPGVRRAFNTLLY